MEERWRADPGKKYYTIDFYLELRIFSACDKRLGVANTRYKTGNYFRTEAEAQAAADEMQKVLLRRAGELKDFMWAYSQMKQGKKIKRPNMLEKEHLYMDGDSIMNNFCWEAYSISVSEIEAADWEIYEEPTE